MTKPKINVGIFSGRFEPSTSHVVMAEKLGRLLAENDIGIVNGGGSGLMAAVARGVVEAGGYVTGVHLDIENREVSPHNTETHRYTDIQERQQKIIDLSDLFIALPGGLGTLYEIVEVMALKNIGELQKEKQLILVDHEHWQEFDALISSLVATGYTHEETKRLYTICDTPEEVLAAILHPRD